MRYTPSLLLSLVLKIRDGIFQARPSEHPVMSIIVSFNSKPDAIKISETDSSLQVLLLITYLFSPCPWSVSSDFGVWRASQLDVSR